MQFRIADTFTDSLVKLTGDEQKSVKTTAFDLQMNPAQPSLQMHRLDRARDSRFWSVRVSRDVRIIVHRSESSMLLCYVDHHDDAYRWAERRRLEIHPKTGAAQLVEVRETVQKITIPRYVESDEPEPQKPPLFSDVSDDDLLGFGVPYEWLDDVRLANEDTVLELADHLPGEAAEALLTLATGGVPTARISEVREDPFDHPDAKRRFRVMSNVEELERALEFPWEKWTIFLHPEQSEFVKREYSGPARVSGSAGTGKTVVALHRAAYLARRNPDSRILLTTFSDTLASALRVKMMRLLGSQPSLGKRLEVSSMNEIGHRLYESNFGRVELASTQTIRQLLRDSSHAVERHRFSEHFLFTEWDQVVDAWQLKSWEEYRDVKRLGRKTRLPEQQRRLLWSIFDQVRTTLADQNLRTRADIFSRLARHFAGSEQTPFDFVVVDEAQDVSVAQLRFLSSIGGRPDGLFFAGDLGQRIFQQPFSWRSLGVDIRGRSRTLKINYRTSHQIRTQADRLLGLEVADVDGNTEDRRGTVSAFNGADPEIRAFDSIEEEIRFVAEWITNLSETGILPHEVGIFVRSSEETDRAVRAVESAGILCNRLDEGIEIRRNHVSVSTMHLAKGMEFRAVAVMACDDEVIPSQARIETVTDEADLTEVYETERHLLYVACTRARDHLLVTCGDLPSEFIEDLQRLEIG